MGPTLLDGRPRAVAGIAVVITAAVMLGCGGGDNGGGESSSDGRGKEESGSAHIDTRVGSTNGIKPDKRAGIVPPPVRVTDLEKAAEKAGCYLELHLKDEGHQHIPPDSPEPNYKTDPPSSGPHVEPPYQQADGAYLEEPKAIDYVHSLEHGRMAIQYAPDLPEEIQKELKGLYDTMYGATLLFPNGKMNYALAASTWTNVLACTGWEGARTLDAIRDFGKATWGKYGGEPVEAFTFTGPTPAEPEEP